MSGKLLGNGKWLAVNLANKTRAGGKDGRTLVDLILLWDKYHGINLKQLFIY